MSTTFTTLREDRLAHLYVQVQQVLPEVREARKDFQREITFRAPHFFWAPSKRQDLIHKNYPFPFLTENSPTEPDWEEQSTSSESNHRQQSSLNTSVLMRKVQGQAGKWDQYQQVQDQTLAYLKHSLRKAQEKEAELRAPLGQSFFPNSTIPGYICTVLEPLLGTAMVPGGVAVCRSHFVCSGPGSSRGKRKEWYRLCYLLNR